MAMTILKLNLKALRNLLMYSVKSIATSKCPNHTYAYQQNSYVLVVEAHLKLTIKGNTMHKPKFKIGDTVYIKKGEIGSAGGSYSSNEDSPSTKIIRMWSKGEYLYEVACSAQEWREDSLELVEQRRKALLGIQSLQDYEKMYDQDFGTILKLPTGYVFSKPVTFIPIKLKETL